MGEIENTDVPLQNCSIFSSHNTLLGSNQIDGKLTLEHLTDLIFLTHLFPVCVEIDIEVLKTDIYLKYLECEYPDQINYKPIFVGHCNTPSPKEKYDIDKSSSWYEFFWKGKESCMKSPWAEMPRKMRIKMRIVPNACWKVDETQLKVTRQKLTIINSARKVNDKKIRDGRQWEFKIAPSLASQKSSFSGSVVGTGVAALPKRHLGAYSLEDVLYYIQHTYLILQNQNKDRLWPLIVTFDSTNTTIPPWSMETTPDICNAMNEIINRTLRHPTIATPTPTPSESIESIKITQLKNKILIRGEYWLDPDIPKRHKDKSSNTFPIDSSFIKQNKLVTQDKSYDNRIVRVYPAYPKKLGEKRRQNHHNINNTLVITMAIEMASEFHGKSEGINMIAFNMQTLKKEKNQVPNSVDEPSIYNGPSIQTIIQNIVNKYDDDFYTLFRAYHNIYKDFSFDLLDTDSSAGGGYITPKRLRSIERGNKINKKSSKKINNIKSKNTKRKKCNTKSNKNHIT